MLEQDEKRRTGALCNDDVTSVTATERNLDAEEQECKEGPSTIEWENKGSSSLSSNIESTKIQGFDTGYDASSETREELVAIHHPKVEMRIGEELVHSPSRLQDLFDTWQSHKCSPCCKSMVTVFDDIRDWI